MIRKEVYDYNKAQLVNYLRYEAGSSNPKYFHSVKEGGMKLQQVPEEYAELLLLLKGFNAETYLALGIGNGGSFAMECFFMKETLKSAYAVDSLAYKNLGIGQNENEISDFIKEALDYVSSKTQLAFINNTTDSFFDFPEAKDQKYDVVFIDADHSYEGARKDYNNSLKHINKSGLIIFHDINSAACPGIKRLWSEAKKDHSTYKEFIHSKTCGIGVIQVK